MKRNFEKILSLNELKQLQIATAELSKAITFKQIVKTVAKNIRSYIKSEADALWIGNEYGEIPLFYSNGIKDAEIALLAKKISRKKNKSSPLIEENGAYFMSILGTKKKIAGVLVFPKLSIHQKEIIFISCLLHQAQNALVRAEKYEVNTLLRKETEQSLLRIEGLQRVTSLLSGATTKVQVAKIIVHEGFNILGAKNGELVLVEPKTIDHKVLAYKGYSKKYVKNWPKITEDTPLLTSIVIKTKKPYYVYDADKLPDTFTVAKEFLQMSKAKSAALLPLIIHKNVAGVVQFTFKNLQQFSDKDKQFMNTIAYQCAQALDRVIAHEDVEKSKEELEVILQQIANGVIVRNHEGNILYVNPLAAKIHQVPSQEQLQNISKEAYYNLFSSITDDQAVSQPLNTLPFMQVLSGSVFAEGTFRVDFPNSSQQYWLNFKSVSIYSDQKKLDLIVDVVTDVTKQKTKEQQKDDFIGIASHELKTPVTVMKTYAHLIKNRLNKIGDNDSFALIGKMDAQIDKLTELIIDLLDVSKIEGGKLQFNEEAFSFDALVSESVEEIQNTTKTHLIRIEGKTNKKVFADRNRISQVIVNFLTNAIKYSPHAKEVTVGLSANETAITFSVKDYGIGIPKDAQPYVFEKFFRELDSRSQTFPGLGLGLYIASEIIKRQNGKIWLHSEEGKGSTFYFSLPI